MWSTIEGYSRAQASTLCHNLRSRPQNTTPTPIANTNAGQHARYTLGTRDTRQTHTRYTTGHTLCTHTRYAQDTRAQRKAPAQNPRSGHKTPHQPKPGATKGPQPNEPRLLAANNPAFRCKQKENPATTRVTGFYKWRWRELNPRPTIDPGIFSGCSLQSISLPSATSRHDR